MPYIKGGTTQSKSSRPEVADVYHSPTVFANNVPVALHLEPIPSAALAFPAPILVSLTQAQIEGIATSSAAATSPEEAEVGLTNRGEVPQEGDAGALTPDVPPTGSLWIDIARNLDLCLSEARQGLWRETGSNPRIIACYKAAGNNINNDRVPWCAGFATSILKKAGGPARATLSSLAYRGIGTSIPIGDKSRWRLNDIVVFSRNGGGHIGFFRAYNPANGSMLIAGGNQDDNLNETSFRGSGSMPVVYVGRVASVPPEYDRPVTFTGAAGSSNVKVV
jgi:uncharacterized protein (TIGR02594 family)